MNAPSPAVATAEAEEDFPWQRIDDTTEQVAAQGDTAPSPRPPLAPAHSGEQRAVARQKATNMLVVGLMVGAGVLVVVVGGLIWGGYLIYTNFIAPQVPGGPARPKLIVTKDAAGKQGVYRTIQAALRVASKDDVIEIADETIEENVVCEYSPRYTTEVTLQAAEGKQVVWRSARKDLPTEPLLKLNGAAFFKLNGNGITLDGDLGEKGKIKDLVLVTSVCPGLTIDGVELKNYSRSGICVMNAEGSLEFPMSLKAISALTGPVDKEGSVFYIDAKPEMRIKQVDYIEIIEPQTSGIAADKVLRVENGVLGTNYVKLPK